MATAIKKSSVLTLSGHPNSPSEFDLPADAVLKELFLEGADWRNDYHDKWRDLIKKRRFQPVMTPGTGTLTEIRDKYDSIAWLGDSIASAITAIEYLAKTGTDFLLVWDTAGKGGYAVLHNLGRYKNWVRSRENHSYLLQNDAGYDAKRDPIPVSEFPCWLRPHGNEVILVSERVLRNAMQHAPQYNRAFSYAYNMPFSLVGPRKFPQPLIHYLNGSTPRWVHQILDGEIMWGIVQLWTWLKSTPDLDQFHQAFRTVWYSVVDQFTTGNNPFNA